MTTGNRAAILHGQRDLRIEVIPRRPLAEDEVRVAVEAVGICGSDVHYYEHGRIGDAIVAAPMIIGHEAAGRIVEVGAAVPADRVGEVVALEPGVPCRTCPQCAAGRYNLCPDVRFFATPPVDGAIVEQVSLRADLAHPAPDGLTAEQAAMAEPVSVAIWANQKGAVTLGDRVLVTGAGPIGILAAQVATARGAAHVAVSDVNPERLRAAAKLGITAVDARQAAPEGFDVLLECSGAAAAFQSGIRQLVRGGRAVLVGMGSDTVEVDVPLLQSRELTLTGTFRYANTYPTALHLIATDQVRVDALITHRFPLADTVDALTVATRDPAALKAVVHPHR